MDFLRMRWNHKILEWKRSNTFSFLMRLNNEQYLVHFMPFFFDYHSLLKKTVASPLHLLNAFTINNESIYTMQKIHPDQLGKGKHC